MSNANKPSMQYALIFDTGYNLTSIKRELQNHGAKDIGIEHITCTTDRGEQYLGYEIAFGSSDTDFIEKMLQLYHGQLCTNNSKIDTDNLPNFDDSLIFDVGNDLDIDIPF